MLGKLTHETKLLQWRVIRKLRREVTVRTKQGTFIVSCQDNVISKALYCTGEFESDLMVKVIALLQPKGTLLEVGANMGITSIGMLHTGLMRKAIAIEPEPYNFSLLQRNVRQNGLEDRIICLPYAVADKDGAIQFELNEHNFGDHRVRITTGDGLHQESKRRVIEVEAKPIDDLLRKVPTTFTGDIGLIWVDVQGYEAHVFLSGKDLFSRNIPVVTEIWPYGIRRAGMSPERFRNIVTEIWSSCWIMRNGTFVQYSVAELPTLFDELGYEGRHTNVIFTN